MMREMLFRTVVELPSTGPQLTPASEVVLLGSCFAQHVGERLTSALPSGAVDVNAAGVLYNPLSIAAVLSAILPDAAPWPEAAYFRGRDERWHNHFYASAFSASTLEACRNNVETRRAQASRLLAEADLVIATFGTDHAYFLADPPEGYPPGLPVGNCHKEPAATFKERILLFDEMLSAWLPLIDFLAAKPRPARLVLTVSPYRYAKYGFHASAVSKGRLLQLCDELQRLRPDTVSYFPAYEIVVDELRDYRFYAPDMLHPSDVAIDYVWQRFQQTTFTPELQREAEERLRQAKRAAHRTIIGNI